MFSSYVWRDLKERYKKVTTAKKKMKHKSWLHEKRSDYDEILSFNSLSRGTTLIYWNFITFQLIVDPRLWHLINFYYHKFVDLLIFNELFLNDMNELAQFSGN